MYFPCKKERRTLVTKLVVVELVEVTKLAKKNHQENVTLSRSFRLY